MVNTSNIVLSKTGDDVLVLFHNWEELFPAFPPSVWHWSSSVIDRLHNFELCFFCLYFVKTFYHERILNLLKILSASIEMVPGFLFFLLLMCYDLSWLANVELRFHVWDKSHLWWSSCVTCFGVMLGLVCWEFLHLCLWRTLIWQFLCVLCLWFGIWIVLAS